MRQKLPYIFLFSLVVLLAFLFGVRHGRNVERIDKYFYFLLSLTPTRSPSPTPNLYSFKLLEFKQCKTSFVYPENLKIDKNKQTLKLLAREKTILEISCSKEKQKTKEEGKKIELKFKNKKIEGLEKDRFIIIYYRSEINNLYYFIKTIPEFYPLIASSINFEK